MKNLEWELSDHHRRYNKRGETLKLMCIGVLEKRILRVMLVPGAKIYIL